VKLLIWYVRRRADLPCDGSTTMAVIFSHDLLIVLPDKRGIGALAAMETTKCRGNERGESPALVTRRPGRIFEIADTENF